MSCQAQTINSKAEQYSQQAGALQAGIDQCTTAINQVNGILIEVGDILAVRSINGILIWKVNEVEKRIEERRIGNILGLYSPPFYMSIGCAYDYIWMMTVKAKECMCHCCW